MKRTIALVAITLIALTAAFAAQTSLRDYLMDAKYQAAGISYSSDIGYIASPKGNAMAVAGPDVSITVYNPEGELDYTLSGKCFVKPERQAIICNVIGIPPGTAFEREES